MDLLESKNLGPTSAAWLRAVGVRTVDDLRELGPLEAYARVVAHGFNATVLLLYALEGAVTETHWNDLSPETKARLRAESDRIKRQSPSR